MKIHAESRQIWHAGHHIFRDQAREDLHGSLGCHQAEHAGRSYQEQSLGDELPNQPATRCSEGAAHCDFTPAAFGADQHKARHINPGDQQQKSSSTQQHQENRADVLYKHVGEGRHKCTLATIVGRILHLELTCDRLHVGQRR